MRIVKYRTSWSYLGSGTKRVHPLTDFVLDILYLMENTGVIPPLVVLNTVLRSGGTGGGMGPETSWKPFEISEAEYAELVNTLCTLDVAQARQHHPYVRFEQVIIDPELNLCTDYLDWLQRSHAQYRQDQ
jgi:hypothetical protein